MKSLLWLPLLFSVLFFTSCKKEEIINQVTPNRTIIYDVLATDWTYNTSRGAWEVKVPMPEIDQAVMYNDAILVYASYDGEKTYEALANVYDGTTFFYEYTIGALYIMTQYSNGDPTNAPTFGFRTKIVIVQSESQG